VHRFGSSIGLAVAVVTLATVVVEQLQHDAPPEWTPYLATAATIIAACGSALRAVQTVAGEQPAPKRKRRKKTRPVPADAPLPAPTPTPLGWVVPKLVRLPEKPRRQPKKAAPSRDDARPDIPIGGADYPKAARKAAAKRAAKKTARRRPASERGE
jgi:hypothetical protein